MKRNHIFWALTGLLLAPAFAIAQALTFSPEHPTPGADLTIQYNAVGTALEGIEFLTTAYLFEGDTPRAVEVLMAGRDGKYTGKIKTSENTRAVFVVLQNPNGDETDNNDGKGYKTLLYRDGKPVPGARLAKGNAYGVYARNMGLEADYAHALKAYRKEFEAYPASLNDPQVKGRFAWFATKTGDEAALARLNDWIAELEGKTDKSEEAWSLLANLYRYTKNRDKYQATQTAYQTAFPDGKWKMNQLRSQFYNSNDLNEQIEIAQTFKEKYGDVEGADNYLNGFKETLAAQYAKQKDTENFEKTLNQITSPTAKAGIFNNLAWDMAGGGLEGEATDLETAEKYARQALQLLEEAKNNADLRDPMLTPTQWRQNLQNMWGMYADTYALILYKLNRFDEALTYQTKACESAHWEGGELVERYAIYHEKAKGGTETEAVLRDLIARGQATLKMKDQYKRLFLANNTLESAFDKHLAALEATALQKMKAELEKELTDQPAPDFELVNLEGKTYRLSDLKGKIVILDFWATWCGPCKASFPAMQTAVNTYKDRDDVLFLFVNTWERSNDKQKNAADFIAGKNYPFNVLLDTEDKVVASYGVEGIPTKFVIDQKGKIRFKSIGFNGDDELIKEISLLIDILDGDQKGATSP